MKKIILALVTLACMGCGESKNQLMTKLINKKKPLVDSVEMAGLKETEYMLKAKAAVRDGEDSTVWHSYIDTSTLYLIHKSELSDQLNGIEFSIDSLSKMK